MRLLFIADGITPFTIGGMQRHSSSLVKYLLKNGQVHLQLAFTADKEILESEVLQALEVNRNDSNFDFKVFENQKFLKLPGHYVRESKAMSSLIFNFFKEDIHNYDVIYCKGLLSYEFVRQKNKGKLKVPLIVNLHGYEMFQEAPNLKIKLQHVFFLRNVTRHIMKGADWVVSYGAKITELLNAINIYNVLEIPSGISDDWIVQDVSRLSKGCINVVFMGRYERRKGIVEIHEMLRLRNDSLSERFTFHFIGPIPEEVRVKGSNIHYHGSIREVKEIQKLLDQMDVLLCPSYSEGMPNVILEAMARGLAIIATDVGAVSLMVNKNNGVLLSDPSSESIASALNEINSLTLNQMKSSSLEKIKEFRWTEIAKVTVSKLNYVINGGA